MYTRDVVKTVTHLEDSDIKYVLGVCLRRPIPDNLVSSGELLTLLVYDLLKQLGFTSERLASIFMHCGDRLMKIGKSYEIVKKGDKVPMVALQIEDNTLVMFSDETEVYDFRKMELVEQTAVPVLSLGIVLPVLYQRALSTALSTVDRHSAVVTQSPQKPADAGGD